MTKKKLLLIGLDGADWRLIRPLLKKKKLPNLQKVISSGVSGVLDSTIPPWTIPAWEVLCTGLTPAELKLPTFLKRKDYSFEPYLFTYKPKKRFFDVLSKKGFKVVIANLPNIASAYKINGKIISGWFCTSEEKLSYPKDLIDKLEKRLGKKYLIDIVGEGRKEVERIVAASENNQKYLKQLLGLIKLRAEFYKELLKDKWNFAFLVFVAPDRIQHRTWDGKIIAKLYCQIDKVLGELIAILKKNSNIIIVSDHGFGKVEEVFNINEWLIKKKYLVLKEKKSKRPRVKKPLKLTKELLKQKARPLYDLLKAILNLFPEFKHMIRENVMAKKILEVDINWKKTKAWAVGPWGGIHINLKGRESNGVVLKREYDNFIEKLIKELKEVNIKALIKKGVDCKNGGPDLFIIPSDNGIQSISTDIGSGEIFSKINSAQHRREGIFIASGPEFKKDRGFKKFNIEEVAEMVLRLFSIKT